MYRAVTALLIAATMLASLAGPVAARPPSDEARPAKVAIIVGPVGPKLTPTYIELAELAAAAAEDRGAQVARAFSPDATAEKVLAAVEDATIVVYFGHGIGSPNPYSEHPSPSVVNGWALNGRNPSDDHADSVSDGNLAYFGEAWIAANARPAPGWVMVYSNACYAPGAGEGFQPPANEETAAARVSAYSRTPLADLGASAYFATDFYGGGAELVATLLDHPDAPYGEVFAAESRYRADAVTVLPHQSVTGAETWLHRSPYFEGVTDYWYAFAGDPTASLSGSPIASRGPLEPGGVADLSTEAGFVSGQASSYSHSSGWEDEATVALPVALGGHIPKGTPDEVLVCGDRCVVLPVVDSCPCYVGTADQRIANLSHAAWELVTDAPLEEGLVQVEVYFVDRLPNEVPGRAPGGMPRA